MSVESVLRWIEDNQEASIGRLVEWLGIPSISTDPAYRDACVKAAAWSATALEECGFAARVIPTGDPRHPGDLSQGGGHPIVLAHSPGDPSYKGPHVLFYGHYDVQPVDPIDLWESDPFDPVVRDARPGESGGRRVVARGAVDDKGQVTTFLEAMRAWKHAAGSPAAGVKMTVLLEGEEETGSVNLESFVKKHRGELSGCDVCLISDTGMLGRGKPAITYGVRGLAYTEVSLHAANQDLHSGLWGGRCPNPITELTRVLAQLHDSKRRVTLPGFYAHVKPLSKQERANWKSLKFNARAALRKIGIPPAGDVGEAGFTALEREWGRPTAEINGIVGGYTGKGAKTVIPSHASAKVSFRLVADQDPGKITRLFFKWCKDRTPPGCRWEFTDHHGGPGVTTPIDSPSMRAAARALTGASRKKPALIKSGGSIPVAGMLKAVLGIDTIFMGFGLDDDRVHSPNEKFEIECLAMGTRSHARFVHELRAL
ncbi:MAG: M20/M25/M40 family metallo-hydrolase [Phycisphaeraceae bacterium]|nr:M20/M25/M40 family metallo-hydrolase [Phycisphaerae bacterium]MBX3391510.1 M20/M25/M40 family metallo-hydrolase [Phycisphaeraceae bacterium]